MFDKKKINFWRLAFLFAGFTAIALTLLWGLPGEPDAQMMDSSMGNTMKQMHVANVTIYDLVSNQESQDQMSSMHSGQKGQSPVIMRLNFLTTGMIFLLLPLIVGGTIVLTIVWYR